METYYNWGELLAPAPVAISTLGQLILMSNQRLDFPIDAKPPKDGFKHIEYPRSFRATLVQISHSGYRAFLKAHTNMATIRGLSAAVPGHVKNVVRYLTNKNKKLISAQLPWNLNKIRESADKSQILAQAVANEFKKVLDLIQETLVAVTATKDDQENSFEIIKERFDATAASQTYINEEAKLLSSKNEQLDKIFNNFKKGQRYSYIVTRHGDRCEVSHLDEKIPPSQTEREGEKKTAFGHRHPDVFFNAGNWWYTFEESRLNLDRCLEENEQSLVNMLRTSKEFQARCASWQKSRRSAHFALDASQEIGKVFADDALPNCPSFKKVVEKGRELRSKLTHEKMKTLRKTDKCPGLNETKQLTLLIADIRATKIKQIYKEKTIVLHNVKKKEGALNFVFQHQKDMMEDLINTTEKMVELNGKKMQVMRHQMEEILKDLQGWNMVHLSYKEAVQVLEKGMQQLSRLKKDWDKLMEFFARISNLVSQAAKDSENFALYTSTELVGYNPSEGNEVFIEELMYRAEKVNAVSLFVANLASVYVRVSDRYIIDRIVGLNQFSSVDANRIGEAGIAKEQESLSKNGQLAFNGIVQKMIEEEKKTFEKILARRDLLLKNDYDKLRNQCGIMPKKDPKLGVYEADGM